MESRLCRSVYGDFEPFPHRHCGCETTDTETGCGFEADGVWDALDCVLGREDVLLETARADVAVVCALNTYVSISSAEAVLMRGILTRPDSRAYSQTPNVLADLLHDSGHFSSCHPWIFREAEVPVYGFPVDGVEADGAGPYEHFIVVLYFWSRESRIQMICILCNDCESFLRVGC